MLCVIARIDPEAAEKLSRLRAVVPGCPAGPLYGHVTIASYIGEDEPAFIAGCRELSSGMPAFDLRYSRIDVLEETSVIVAVPEKSEPLFALHQAISDRFGDALDPWTRGNAWVPHTTLIYDPDADLHVLRQRLLEGFRPFSAHVRSVEFSRVLDHGFEIAGSITLR